MNQYIFQSVKMDKIILDDTSNQNRTDAFYLEGRRYTNLTILVEKIKDIVL